MEKGPDSPKTIWRLNNTSDKVPHKCEYCDRVFTKGRKSRSYQYHMQSVHGRHNYRCSSCPFKANMPKDIIIHMEQMGHEDTTVACPYCKEKVDKTEISDHSISCCHKKARERQANYQFHCDPCPTCGKVITTKKAYARHLMMHLRQKGEQEPVSVPYTKEKQKLYFFCDKCDRKFIENYLLQKHIQVSHEFDLPHIKIVDVGPRRNLYYIQISLS